MPGIDWAAFSWEAFATLVAGLAAVLGAVVVALRQQRILKHQTTIERLKLRSETFDRRWEIYQTASSWLLDWWQREHTPNRELDKQFVFALEKSKFLFRPEVYEVMAMWHTKRRRGRLLYDRLNRQRLSEPDMEKIKIEVLAIDEVRDAAFKEIADLFGQEMQMSEHHSALEPLMKPPQEKSN